MMARWWLRAPLTFQLLVGLALVAPCLLTLPFALSGHPVEPFSGLSGLGGSIGMLVSARLREPNYWRLDKAGRRRVREVQLTGNPSGDPEVDRIALGRLTAAVKNERANTIGMRILSVPVFGLPVVAAVRTGHWWWLIAALPAVLLLSKMLPVARRGDSPRVRLNRLVDQVG